MVSNPKLIAIACLSGCIALLLAPPALAQKTTFKNVMIRFSKSGKDRKLVEAPGTLIFDDTLRKLVVKSSKKPLEIRYDDVAQVVFDRTRHVRGGSAAKELAFGTLSDMVSGAGALGAAIGAAIDVGADVKRSSLPVTDYWMLIDMKMPGGSTRPTLLQVSRADSEHVIAKAEQLFGKDMHIALFSEIGHEIDKKDLKDAGAKHSMTVDKVNHPEPPIQPDKALVVVAFPNVAITGSGRWQFKLGQFKLHANDSIVAVNETGTYSFAYLDPGEYLMASQAGYLGGNANGFKMKLDAGSDYYFLHNIVPGSIGYRTVLSRNAKEIVMFEVQGSYYAEWKRKP
jgi:hypothetical protein